MMEFPRSFTEQRSTKQRDRFRKLLANFFSAEIRGPRRRSITRGLNGSSVVDRGFSGSLPETSATLQVFFGEIIFSRAPASYN